MLEELSDILSAPRRYVMKGLGSILGEDIPESGSGILAKYLGMDPESLLTKGLGFGVDMATDPLTYLLPAAGGLVGKALGRGAALAERGATAAESLGTVAPRVLGAEATAPAGERFLSGLGSGAMYRNAPSSALSEALTPSVTSGEGLAAGARLRPLAESFSRFKNVEGLNPEQTDQLLAMAQSGERMPQGMAGTYISRGGNDPVGFTGDVVRMAEGSRPSKTFSQALDNALTDAEIQARGSNMGGFFEPQSNSVVRMANDPEAALTLRHENLHGIVQNAARTGEYGELSPVGKTAAWLNSPAAQAGNPIEAARLRDTFRGGLGGIMDELHSFSGERRGALDQLKGGLNFLFSNPKEIMGLNPASTDFHNFYMNQISGRSPLAAALYRGLNIAPYAAGAYGVGKLGAGAANNLMYNQAGSTP